MCSRQSEDTKHDEDEVKEMRNPRYVKMRHSAVEIGNTITRPHSRIHDDARSRKVMCKDES